eukprot:2628349-Pyramimonas_sp.AAC.1
MRKTAAAGDAEAEVGALQSRPRCKYLCAKGDELTGTLLLGVRDRSGGSAESLGFTRLKHKDETSKTTGNKLNGSSRALVAAVTLGDPVPPPGNEFNVVVLH